MHALFSLLLTDEGRVSARQRESCEEPPQQSSVHDARLSAGTASADASEKLGDSQEQLGNSQENRNRSTQTGTERAPRATGGGNKGSGGDTSIVSAHFERIADSAGTPVMGSENVTAAKEGAVLRRKQRRTRGRRQVGGRDVT